MTSRIKVITFQGLYPPKMDPSHPVWWRTEHGCYRFCKNMKCRKSIKGILGKTVRMNEVTQGSDIIHVTLFIERAFKRPVYMSDTKLVFYIFIRLDRSIEYSLPCASLSVCLCVCKHNNSKQKWSRILKFENFVGYEKSSDELDIGHHRLKSRSWLFPIYHNTNCQVLYLSFGTRQETVIKYVCSSDINV